MASKPSGLGRGLDALFPLDFGADSVAVNDSKSGVLEIDINLLKPRKDQPRTLFDDEKIEQLSYSITEHGVLQPLVVVMLENGDYSIVAGERRYRASVRAGLKTIPAIVRTASQLEQLEIALVENIQREDLGAIDQAKSIRRLHEEFSQSYDQIAKRLGKADKTIINISRLLQLPEGLQKALTDGQISEGHARTLLSLGKEPDVQAKLFKSIVAEQWTVRKAELFVQAHKESGGDTAGKAKVATKMLTETPETKRISQKLGTQVRITRTAKGGKLTIAFRDDTDLDRLTGLL
jgi:ParB family transcriptional regulator, chromosome partitioning protein